MSQSMNIAGLLVGYGKAEITPEGSVPMDGLGNATKRMSQGVLDPLFLICTAFTDAQGSTVLYFTADTVQSNQVIELIRKPVSEATGVPEDHIMCNASHTHNGPCLWATSVPGVEDYRQLLPPQAVKAALAALEDRKPARMFIGSLPIIGQTFLRHYQLPDGTKAGYDGMIRYNNPVDHVGVQDKQMQLVKFVREGGKDVLLVNFQAHPSKNIHANRYSISADVVGVIRDTLAQELDSEVAYINGASGNMNFTSLIEAEKNKKTYLEQGREVANVVLSSVPYIFTEVKTGKVQVLRHDYCGEVNHTEDHLLEQAEEVRKVWQETNDQKAAAAAGVPYGIRSPYHANAIAARVKLPETMNVPMYVLTIGDVAFITAPYEMFALSGIRIKEGSPFAMTLISAYSNGNVGYMPVEEAFDYECYEAGVTKFVKGTAEKLEKQYLSMLETLYSTR